MTGVHAISALAAHARGDVAACRRDLQRFIEGSLRGRGSPDLFSGLAGRLAGAAIMFRRIAEPDVRALGDHLAARVLAVLAEPSLDLPTRGLAHGRAGIVLGALTWQAAAGSLPPRELRAAVRAVRREGPMPGWIDWAHGDGGLALLYARAYVQLGDRRFLEWARAAAERALAERRDGFSLVDTSPGVAYCMLGVADADPGGPWRDAAWEIVGRVLAHVDIPDFYPYGAWTGLSGLCCLVLDLLHETDEAGFPGIEA